MRRDLEVVNVAVPVRTDRLRRRHARTITAAEN
jgi:hypothetical protein